MSSFSSFFLNHWKLLKYLAQSMIAFQCWELMLSFKSFELGREKALQDK